MRIVEMLIIIKVTVFKGMNLWSNFYFKYYEKNII